MAESNPVLQEKLEELEHELEVSGRFFNLLSPSYICYMRLGGLAPACMYDT